MQKRITRSDYLFMILIILFLFILFLVITASSFLYGVKTGTARTEAKFEAELKRDSEKEAASVKLPAYHQQDLASFYHTIFLPYREFQLSWLQAIEDISNGSNTVNAASLLQSLNTLAQDTFALIEKSSPSSSSPLLQNAQISYMKSLKLFAQAASDSKTKARKLSAVELVKQLNEDAYCIEAKNYGLLGQQQYYRSIVKWHATVQGPLSNLSLLSKTSLTIKEWETLNLNQKIAFAAIMMHQSHHYESFYPQDLVLATDKLIQSGKAASMDMNSVNAISEMLISTHAVRLGDFSNGKKIQYKDELLPLLPFYDDL